MKLTLLVQVQKFRQQLKNMNSMKLHLLTNFRFVKMIQLNRYQHLIQELFMLKKFFSDLLNRLIVKTMSKLKIQSKFYLTNFKPLK